MGDKKKERCHWQCIFSPPNAFSIVTVWMICSKSSFSCKPNLQKYNNIIIREKQRGSEKVQNLPPPPSTASSHFSHYNCCQHYQQDYCGVGSFLSCMGVPVWNSHLPWHIICSEEKPLLVQQKLQEMEKREEFCSVHPMCLSHHICNVILGTTFQIYFWEEPWISAGERMVSSNTGGGERALLSGVC